MAELPQWLHKTDRSECLVKTEEQFAKAKAEGWLTAEELHAALGKDATADAEQTAEVEAEEDGEVSGMIGPGDGDEPVRRKPGPKGKGR